MCNLLDLRKIKMIKEKIKFFLGGVALKGFLIMLMISAANANVNMSDPTEKEKEKKEKKEKKEEKEEKIKSIKELTKDFKKQEGLFTIYTNPKTGKVLIEVTKEQLNKDYMLSVQVIDGSVATSLGRGMYGDVRIFQFRKIYNNLQLVTRNTKYFFDPANPISRAKNANISDAILIMEKIKGHNKKENRFIIDATKLFKSQKLTRLKYKPRLFKIGLGSVNKNKTRISKLTNYPKNLTVVTDFTFDNFSVSSFGDTRGITDIRVITVSIQHNFMELPDEGYTLRKDDARVGFFMTKRDDKTSKEVTPWNDVIHRWRLIKKDPSAAISEPIKPITFWMENTTPYELRSTIKTAVESWNIAFEAAGFKNAIVVKQQGDDASWDAGDIRYNVLRWVSSPSVRYAGYGPHHANPLTGEIFSADIMLEYAFLTKHMKKANIYENNKIDGSNDFVESLSEHQKNCALADNLHLGRLLGDVMLMTKDGTGEEHKELLRQAVSFLVLHEVGHTLGLTHNMKASSSLPYKNVHKKKKQSFGLVSSVMDYPPTNFAPERSKQAYYYNVRPGIYDIWAIKFGYDPDLNDSQKRKAHLDQSTNPLLAFGNDADDMRIARRGFDPRINVNDMTDDSISYALDRVKMDHQALKNLQNKFMKKGETHQALKNAFRIIIVDLVKQGSILSTWVGGVYLERAIIGQPNSTVSYMPVKRAKQKEAMKAIGKSFFAPDVYDFDIGLLQNLGLQRRGFKTERGKTPSPLRMVRSIHMSILNRLLNPVVLERFSATSLYGNDYSLDEFFGDLTDSIFKADLRGSVNQYRQDLQSLYLKGLISVFKKNGEANIQAVVYMELKRLQVLLKKTRKSNKMTKTHRELLVFQIKKALSIKYLK